MPKTRWRLKTTIASFFDRIYMISSESTQVVYRARDGQSDRFNCLGISSNTLSKTYYVALASILAVSACMELGLLPSSPAVMIGLLAMTPIIAYAIGRLDQCVEPLPEQSRALIGSNVQNSLAQASERATDDVLAAEGRVSKLRQEGQSEEAQALWEQSQVADQRARELNNRSSHLTRYDLLEMRRIFQPPVNEYHTEPDGTRYYEPDSSKINAFIAGQLTCGGYAGYEMASKEKAMNPNTREESLCDCFYFKKQADQVLHEQGIFSFMDLLSEKVHKLCPFLWSSNVSCMQQRIRMQGEIANDKFLPMLRQNLAQWKYSDYLICTRPIDLQQLGGTCKFRPTDLLRAQAIILFYQKVKE
ncbi:MAG: hypothetical protein LLG04_14075 [Parachlamydia sp.]|nr:hypothetical protein [Parachlamydia sp.]